MTVLEGITSFHCLGNASVVVEDRELAWAQPYIRRASDIRWILGNYVQASVDGNWQANSNGHIFPYEDLKDAILGIPHRPLNYLHIPGKRCGTFTAAEFTYPPEGNAAPVVEALAAYWLYYDDEGLFDKVEDAYKEGRLYFSMEAVPEQVTCAKCNALFDYQGPQSETYCDHLRERRSKKILHKPHFVGGALIVPPVKPGWKGAEIKEVSQLLETAGPLVDEAFREIAAEQPQLSGPQIENVMALLLGL